MHTKSILIVEDEARTRVGLTNTLEKWAGGKFRILDAAGGVEAIDVLQQQPVHLLITDIRMPEISGLKLLETLNKFVRDPVAIVVSAYPEFEYAQAAIRLGVVNYLLKPVSKHKLIEAVEQALEVKQKQIRSGIIEKMVDDKLVEINIEDGIASTSIKQAMRYVDEHYERDISLKDVAKQVHLNPSYLSVLFKEETQLTFREYLTRSRLQNAKKMLISTDLPVTEIAEKVGYKTAKYFVKLFRQYEGMTPGSYRRRAK